MGVVTNIIKTVFNSTGAESVVKDTDHLSRAQTRLGQASAGTSRQFAAQASGLGGLVAAYAGAAATAFALQASFSALANSARAAQTFEGLGVLAAKSGEDASKLLASVQEITKSQLTLTAASEQINLALSAGFSGKQIEGLSGVALKASRALGRDLTDALTRVTRGSAKMETELLDELGIYTKIEPATAAYAAAIGKTRLELTEYERRQAFVNSVIAEGERKFSVINTVIPTTAEKIEAFGATIINLATQFGIFLSDKLAPLADFLSNNVVAAFGAVGIAASFVAAKGVTLLKDSLESLSKKAQQKASDIEDYFLRFSKSAQKARDDAQSAIGSIALTKGIGGADQAALKSLKEESKTRTLTGKELESANTILLKRTTNLENLIKAETAEIGKLKEKESKLKAETLALGNDSAALKQNTLELEKNSKALEKSNKALALSNTRLKDTKTQQVAVAEALKGTTSGIAKYTSSALTGIVSLGTSLAHTAGSLVGFAGNILMGISALSLLGSAIADVFGIRDQYNAFIEKIGKGIAGIFTSIDTKQAQKAFVSLSDSALNSLEAADKELKDLDTFTFKTKVVGIDIELTKTKEDLIKEVTLALTTAATQSNKTFGESLASTSGIIGAGVGTKLGIAAGTTIATGLTAALSGIGTVIAPGVGTAIGAVLGALAGGAIGIFTDQVLLGLDELDSSIKDKLSAEYGSEIFTGESGVKLSKALQLIEDQAGAAKDLSFQGKLYYETQQKLAIQLAKNLDNFRELQSLAEKLGIDAATVEKNFNTTVDSLNNLVITPKLAMPDTIEVSITILNEEATLARLASMRDYFNAADSANKLESVALIRGKGRANELMNTLSANLAILNKEKDIVSSQLADAQKKLTKAEQEYAKNPTAGKALQDAANSVNSLSYDYDNLIASITTTTDKLQDLQTAYGVIGTLTKEQALNIDKLTTSFDAFLTLQSTLSTGNAKVSNSFIDLKDSIYNGNISLEQLSQKEGVYKKLIEDSTGSLAAMRDELATQKASRDELATYIDSNPDIGDKALENLLRGLDIANLTLASNSALLAEAEATALANKENANVLELAVAPLRKQLQLAEDLKKAFGDLSVDRSKNFGAVSASGTLLSDPADIKKRQVELLNEELAKSSVYYNQQQRQIEAINKLNDLSIDQKIALSAANKNTIDDEIVRLGITGTSAQLAKQIVQLTYDQAAAANNVNTILTIQKNILAEEKAKVEDLATAFTQNMTKGINDLNQQLADLRSKDNIAKLQFEIDKISLESDAAAAAAAFEQAFRENQIQLIQLQVENKKIEPVAGAEQINTIAAQMKELQVQSLEAERLLATEKHAAALTLQQAEFEATRAKIIAEGEQLKAKIKAEYDVLVAAAETYTAISNQLNTAMVDGGNAAGQALVDAAYAAAQTLASAFGPIGKLLGMGANIVKGSFAAQPYSAATKSVVSPQAGGVDAFVGGLSDVESALISAKSSLNTYTSTIEANVIEQLKMADESFKRNSEIMDARRAEEIRDFERRKILLAQEKQISLEEAEKRLKDAAGGGGGEDKLNEIEKKLQALFDSIKGHIESAIMGLNNLLFYGEGNFGDIMGNLFKSIQQDFFKQTVADPLSSYLTDSVFSMFGISNMRTGIENAKVENGALLVKMVQGPEDLFGSMLGGSKTDPTDPEATGVVGWMSKLFGKDGTVSGFFSNLFGEGGILSNLLGGFGSFLGSIFKAIFGGIFGGGKVTGGIMHMAQGGVAGASALQRDRIPALLEPGEFVVRKPVARMVGTPALNSLNATGRMPNGGAPTINLVNEGSPKDVQQAKPRFDGEKYVIDIILRDLSNNGPIRRSLRGGSS